MKKKSAKNKQINKPNKHKKRQKQTNGKKSELFMLIFVSMQRLHSRKRTMFLRVIVFPLVFKCSWIDRSRDFHLRFIHLVVHLSFSTHDIFLSHECISLRVIISASRFRIESTVDSDGSTNVTFEYYQLVSVGYMFPQKCSSG